MPSRFELYRVKRINGMLEALTQSFFDLRFRDVDDRLAKLEELGISWELALRFVQDRVLAQSERVISDLRDKLVSLTQLQWLTALSDTTRTLIVGNSMAFAIAPDQRELFTPGPYVLLSRAATPDDFGVASTLNYDRDLGQLDVTIEAVTGNPGPHSDWVIAALAGSTLAQMEMLAQAQALQSGVISARDAAFAAASAANISAADAASAAVATAADRVAITQAVAGGPVLQVAGLQGIVSAADLKLALGVAADIASVSSAFTVAINTKANAADVPTTGDIVGLSYGGDTLGF